MSIFYKVVVLFIASIALMFYVSEETNRLTQLKVETLLKEKYIRASGELFKYLSEGDSEKLQEHIESLKFIKLENTDDFLNSSTVVYEHKMSFGALKILKYEDKKYALHLAYLDETLLLIDGVEKSNFLNTYFLDITILIDVTILVVLFLIILKMLFPLKELTSAMKRFGEGDFTLRSSLKSGDEIGELSQSFNIMAKNIEELIYSRERLLSNIAHELRTPISKAKLALEMIDERKNRRVLRGALEQINVMINELLHIESLSAGREILQKSNFGVQRLIADALERLFIEDESLINVKVSREFEIFADLNYLSIALKNLVDNALKYSEERPVEIEVEANVISVKSRGKKLDKPLEYYCEAFTKFDTSRGSEGFGLGLNIVKSVLERHGFELQYVYSEGKNCFCIKL